MTFDLYFWSNTFKINLCFISSLPGVALPYRDSYFGQGEGNIHVLSTDCDGDEENLLQCFHTATQQNCDHTSDVGVRCIFGGEI